MSPGPEIQTVMLASKPLSEKRQRSAALLPPAGRCSVTGFPARVQTLFAVENGPMAATSRSTSSSAVEMPAVVGSTTTMFCPVATGAAVVSGMEASEEFGGATTSSTTLLCVLPGFCTWMETAPATETSPAVTGAMHSVAEVQLVTRAVPATHIADPDELPAGTNPLPSTSSVKPCAAPAYTLAGCSAIMFAPVEMVTAAVPDCVESS